MDETLAQPRPCTASTSRTVAAAKRATPPTVGVLPREATMERMKQSLEGLRAERRWCLAQSHTHGDHLRGEVVAAEAFALWI
jgi:hypothetical protein